MPRIDWQDPNLRILDLDGDGLADVLITANDAFLWYRSRGDSGFAQGQRIAVAHDERKGPAVVFASSSEIIVTADMSGDGLSDLVRVRNGEVCYWPNLGYGRFGAKVTLELSACFDRPDRFEPRRIRFADLDGTGTSDIVYFGSDGIRLYFNQAGNALSAPTRLDTLPSVDAMSHLSVVDIFGQGTACLVWSSPAPASHGRPLVYVDLLSGKKPHLLETVVNNLGAETHISYVPATRFYLADKAAGRPWITRLSFPVHVVERVETFDRISQNRFVNRYTYHHGFFDGVEREFTGKERDKGSGLYYHGTRYYAAQLGRWLSPDPAGMVDGTNLYMYARSNPIVFADPTGNAAQTNNSPSATKTTPEQLRSAEQALRSRFVIDDNLTASSAPHHVTNQQFSNVVNLYARIASGQSDIRIDERSAENVYDRVDETTPFEKAERANQVKRYNRGDFKRLFLEDIARILQTSEGRDLLNKIVSDNSQFTATISLSTKPLVIKGHRRDVANPDDEYEKRDEATRQETIDPDKTRTIRSSGLVQYAPGQTSMLSVAGAPEWAKSRSDVNLFHELAHAYRDMSGTVTFGKPQFGGVLLPMQLVPGDRGQKIPVAEYQVTGLGFFSNIPLSENRYRAQRNAINMLSGDMMPGRPAYSLTLP